MESLKILKNRIKTVSGIVKTTNSMKMVASIKLTKVNNINKESKQCATLLSIMLDKAIKEISQQNKLPLNYWATRSNGQSLIIVLSTNQGFCGAFNQSIIDVALTFIKNNNDAYIEVFGKRGKGIPTNKMELLDNAPPFLPITDFSAYLANLASRYVIEHCVRQVFVVSGFLENVLVQVAQLSRIFPLNVAPQPQNEIVKIETQTLEFLEELFQRYLFKTFNALVTEHLLAEYSARVMAMDASVRNANDMLDKIKILYNKIRQDKITQELTEIVASIECVH